MTENEPRIEELTLADLTPMTDDENARSHNPRNIAMIADSLQEVGAGRSLLVDENRKIIAGNGTYEAAAQAGFERVWLIDAPEDVILARGRRFADERQKTRAALLDNRTAELATWNIPRIEDLRPTGALDGMWKEGELDSLLQRVAPIPDAAEQQEPALLAEHMVEIYCSADVLDKILPTLEKWRSTLDVKIDIS